MERGRRGSRRGPIAGQPDARVRRIVGWVNAIEDRSVPTLRVVRRRASQEIADLSADQVLSLAERLLAEVPAWFAYELVHHHRAALAGLDGAWLARLGNGLSSWGEVDAFACYLAGVAWREGNISDEEVLAWARSRDRWWRRAAVVSTVPLNSASRGGRGDTPRTLSICDVLRSDRDDMVVKGCSWALRELAKVDAEAVRGYVATRRRDLASRVVREVTHKLETGLKNPRREGGKVRR